MRLLNIHIVVIALLCLFSVDAYSQNEVSVSSTKDSTIYTSTVICPACPESSCYKCTRGHEKTLQANTGGPAYVRILIGFKLSVPSSLVNGCTIQLPKFTQALQAPINVTIAQATSSDWDENTVDGMNAPDSDDPFTMVTVPAHTNLGPIDITQACKNAGGDDLFSIYVGTQFGRIEIGSLDSGEPSTLHLAYE
ncbi:hypothetical protein BC940DRAFT_242015 [Gongronella butleri]|nr:hypothetical protein BC940DRAFT_242015 [Gongronella butleri]